MALTKSRTLTVVRGAQADWYDTRGNVADLVTHLLDTTAIRPDQVGEVVEKPWKWTLEFDAMRADEREAEPESVGGDVFSLSRAALSPWPGGDAA